MSEYLHHAILQRLDVFHQNGGRNMFYSSDSFANAADWDGVPVIMPVGDDTRDHPQDFDAIDAGIIPAGYKRIGYITGATIPADGVPRLESDVILTDAEAESLARAGVLGLSTAFRCQDVPDGDEYRLSGRVVPNHVYAFREGACRWCYPNDQGAMLTNRRQQEQNMTDTTTEPAAVADADFSETQKSFFNKFFEKFANVCGGKKRNEDTDAGELPTDEEKIPDESASEIESLKAAIKERDNIIAELRAAEEKRNRDEQWSQLANTLPRAWRENEEQTRAEFESNPAAFTVKLMNHMTQYANAAKPAEGKTGCGCKLTEEQKIENRIESNGRKIGFTPMEE